MKKGIKEDIESILELVRIIEENKEEILKPYTDTVSDIDKLEEESETGTGIEYRQVVNDIVKHCFTNSKYIQDMINTGKSLLEKVHAVECDRKQEYICYLSNAFQQYDDEEYEYVAMDLNMDNMEIFYVDCLDGDLEFIKRVMSEIQELA